MATLYAAMRLLHVFSAALWLGGSAFVVFRYGPAMRAAGPANAPVALSLLRTGGMSVFFAPLALVTLLAGLYVYVAGDYMGSPAGEWPVILLNLGVVAGLVAVALGLYAAWGLEARMKRIARSVQGEPTPDQAVELGTLAMRAGKTSGYVLLSLTIAFLTMAGRHLAA